MSVDRDYLFLGCDHGNHEWVFDGGANAGCDQGNDCGCSVPVHRCIKCGDCDYGDNDEANEVRRDCAVRRADDAVLDTAAADGHTLKRGGRPVEPEAPAPT